MTMAFFCPGSFTSWTAISSDYFFSPPLAQVALLSIWLQLGPGHISGRVLGGLMSRPGESWLPRIMYTSSYAGTLDPGTRVAIFLLGSWFYTDQNATLVYEIRLHNDGD